MRITPRARLVSRIAHIPAAARLKPEGGTDLRHRSFVTVDRESGPVREDHSHLSFAQNTGDPSPGYRTESSVLTGDFRRPRQTGVSSVALPRSSNSTPRRTASERDDTPNFWKIALMWVLTVLGET